jgi:hypothetical protein
MHQTSEARLEKRRKAFVEWVGSLKTKNRTQKRKEVGHYGISRWRRLFGSGAAGPRHVPTAEKTIRAGEHHCPKCTWTKWRIIHRAKRYLDGSIRTPGSFRCRTCGFIQEVAI